MERYAVGNLAKGCGILESYDMTAEAAVTKTHVAPGAKPQHRIYHSIFLYHR